MAEERSRFSEAAPGTVETTDRGMFDFLKKKEDVSKTSDQHDTITPGVEKVHLGQPHEEEEAKHGSLLDKFHRDDDKFSSSSSDEEGDDEEERRRRKERKEKKKAGLKEKFDEKFGHKKEEHHDQYHHDDSTNVPIEKPHLQENVYNEQYYAPPATVVHHDQRHQEEEKKQGGFMDKIKDKLPSGHKDKAGQGATEVTHHDQPHQQEVTHHVQPHHQEVTHHDQRHQEEEKKQGGFMDKIKDKVPSGHKDKAGHGATEVTHHDQPHQQEVTHHVQPHQQVVTHHDQHHQEEEKKQGGCMDKVKDKLHKDKAGQGATEVATPVSVEPYVEEEKEKKGFLDKIKEKIPGLHSKTDEEKKEHEDKQERH